MLRTQVSLDEQDYTLAKKEAAVLAREDTPGDKRLVALARQLPPAQAKRAGDASTPFDQLRYVILRLAENWARYRVFDWQPDVPWTNNLTEQVIGRMKMRARTVRGYKNWQGMFSGLMAAGVNLA